MLCFTVKKLQILSLWLWKYGLLQLFQGSTSSSESNDINELFSEPIETRYLRIEPLRWSPAIVLRIIGCAEEIGATTVAPTLPPPGKSSKLVVILLYVSCESQYFHK